MAKINEIMSLILYNEQKEQTGIQSDVKKEMNLEELENVTGGTGASSGKVETEGKVIEYSGQGIFQVHIGGATIAASLSGQLRTNYIRVMRGDRVRVEYTPGDAYGQITYRYYTH